MQAFAGQSLEDAKKRSAKWQAGSVGVNDSELECRRCRHCICNCICNLVRKRSSIYSSCWPARLLQLCTTLVHNIAAHTPTRTHRYLCYPCSYEAQEQDSQGTGVSIHPQGFVASRVIASACCWLLTRAPGVPENRDTSYIVAMALRLVTCCWHIKSVLSCLWHCTMLPAADRDRYYTYRHQWEVT